MITAQQHSKTIASKVVGKFKEDIPVRSGFAGWFPRETTKTLHVDVEVERDNDLIAVDVQRFTEGRKSKYTISSEHKYVPPFYRQEYDFARDEVYMNTVALGVSTNASVNQAIAQNALKNMRKERKKIERAIAKQQADVLQTGIVSMKNGDSIDFRRKAGSMVDLSANPWSAAGTDIDGQISDAMRFLRDEANSTGGEINLVMGGTALSGFLNNTSLNKKLESRRMDRANIVMPQFNEASGMAFHGQVAAGDFILNLWTYNEKYTDGAGTTQRYLDPKNAVILPTDFSGKTVFGGLPFMRNVTIGGERTEVPGVTEAEYLLRAYSDTKTISSTLELSSAPLVVPFTIDKVYTMKVLA